MHETTKHIWNKCILTDQYVLTAIEHTKMDFIIVYAIPNIIFVNGKILSYIKTFLIQLKYITL